MIGRRQDPASLLPLGSSAFHILIALAGGERNGYCVGKDVEAATGGKVRLGPGTLYRLLKQMATDGWIVESHRDDADPLRRRYYRLTPWGRRIAQAEIARLEELLRLARSQRLLQVPG